MSVREQETYLELSCDLSELEKIKACIFGLSADTGLKKKIFLACDEIFSNIAMYSGADWVRFSCSEDAEKAAITFTDNGIAFNPLESRAEKDFEDLDLGGMGINLVRELCSRIRYSNVQGTNILSLEFAWNI